MGKKQVVMISGGINYLAVIMHYKPFNHIGVVVSLYIVTKKEKSTWLFFMLPPEICLESLARTLRSIP